MLPNPLALLPDMRLRTVTAAALAAMSLLCGTARAQQTLTLALPDETITYELRRLEPRSAIARDEAVPEAGALDTARRIARHLAAGEIEDAALLSNAPKRRFEVLVDYRDSVGADEFRRVYGEYADPRNAVLAEIVIGAHRALLWRLGQSGALAAQYYVDVDGRFLLDDVPSDGRTRLRRIVEAYRSGNLTLGPPGRDS